MSTPTNREWIIEGGEVAVTTDGPFGSTEFVRIARITDTVIVLADGRRYNRGTLVERENRSRPDTRLTDTRDPASVRAFARQQLREFARAADRLVSGSSATVNQMTPQEVRDALDALAGQLDTARKELDRRAGL